jgi:hypothetical protein
MKKRLVLLSSITVAALLTFNACGSSVTRDDQSFTSGDKDGHARAIEKPTEPKIDTPAINSPLAPVVDTPTVDNNDSESMVKVDAKNAYKLSMTLSKDRFQQEEDGVLEYNIKEIYSGDIVENAILEKVTLSVADKRYMKFVDFQGTETNSFEITKNVKSEDKIRVKMGENSGTTEIEVKADIRLADGKTYSLKNTIPVVVMKNVTSSVTVNSYGAKFMKDGENAGLFVEKFVFHVVDNHGDKAKDGTYLQSGVVNNPKVYTLGIDPDKAKVKYSDGNFIKLRSYADYGDEYRLYTSAKISRDKSFVIDSNDTSLLNRVDSEDKVVILPNRDKKDPTYLGSWSISSIDKSVNKIVLKDDYTGNDRMSIGDTDGLTFVIGDEDRYNPCGHTLANAALYFPNGSTSGAKVEDGIVHAELRYQPYMVGKTVFVYANAIVNGERIGIAREVHLTGEGINSGSYSCAGTDKEPRTCTFNLGVILNGYEDFARDLTSGFIRTDGDGPSMVDTTYLNTGCSGHSYVTVTMDINKSASFEIGGSTLHENIINQK